MNPVEAADSKEPSMETSEKKTESELPALPPQETPAAVDPPPQSEPTEKKEEAAS